MELRLDTRRVQQETFRTNTQVFGLMDLMIENLMSSIFYQNIFVQQSFFCYTFRNSFAERFSEF